jgi:hypothetical protein
VRYTDISLSYQICGMVLVGTTPIPGHYLHGVIVSIQSVVALDVLRVLITLFRALSLIARMQQQR